MKKQLLMAGFLLAGIFSVNAQVLQSDNFDSYTVGNLSSDLTGETAGQGGWYTYAGNGATAANFKIVAEGSGKALQIDGVNTTSGTTQQTDNTRYAWKGVLDWASRTTGNNIIRLEYDLYTGPTSTSKNLHRGVILNSQGLSLAGYQYAPETKQLRGMITAINPQTNQPALYVVDFGGTEQTPAPLVLQINTWYKVIVYINYTNGKVTYQIPSLDIAAEVTNAIFSGAGAATYAPIEIDFLAIGGTGNTASSTIKYDNYNASAVNSETASVDDHLSQQFAMYPNPTTGIVNITNNENVLVSQVNVMDLNGRVVKTVKFDNVSEAQVDISGLSAGMYIMNITTNQGIATKKVVKK